MEDAERAIKRVRDELAVKDKANGTSVGEVEGLGDGRACRLYTSDAPDE